MFSRKVLAEKTEKNHKRKTNHLRGRIVSELRQVQGSAQICAVPRFRFPGGPRFEKLCLGGGKCQNGKK